jgi:hypothetical protein
VRLAAWRMAWGCGMCTPVASARAAWIQPSASAVVNDFAGILAVCPNLQLIAHNGGESFKHARHTQALGVPVVKLPSSSPANASWSFERKKAAWVAALLAVLGAWPVSVGLRGVVATRWQRSHRACPAINRRCGTTQGFPVPDSLPIQRWWPRLCGCRSTPASSGRCGCRGAHTAAGLRV